MLKKRMAIKLTILLLFAGVFAALFLSPLSAPIKALKWGLDNGVKNDMGTLHAAEVFFGWKDSGVYVSTPGTDVTDTLSYPARGQVTKNYSSAEPFVALKAESPLLAPGDGKIIYCREGTIVIEHAWQVYSLIKFEGKSGKLAGDYVTRGQEIGTLEKETIYYGMRTFDGKMLNPADYCKAP